jgi:peptidyl-prolyl cis-trans isomerase B (cyclophilin B)
MAATSDHLEVARMIRFLVACMAVVALVAGVAMAQDKPPAPPRAAAKAPTALVTLEKGGEIVLEFWPQDAPRHVENFVKLAREKFYDGQRVHRVEPNFVVQFGDPQSKTLPLNDPRMGTGGPGYTIKAEFNKRPFERGVLGMARKGDPDSAGSQVYIMLGAAPHLNGKYTAFGKVVTGMGVVDQIRVGDRIKSIRIITQ